ncbi:MAG: hypothetical protein ABEH77_00940 [Halobacteriaceae archaeon]
MADGEPDSLVAALGVPRQARRGFGAAALLSAALFAVFVAGPTTDRPVVLYVALGAVFAFAAGLLLTGVLVAAAAYRLVRAD